MREGTAEKGVGKREDPRRIALIPRDFLYYLYNTAARSVYRVSCNTLTLKKKYQNFQLEQIITSKNFATNKNAPKTPRSEF